MKNIIKRLEAIGEFIKAARLEKLISGATEEMLYKGKPITEQEASDLVKENGLVIRFIENPSEAVKLEAVKQNGFTIQYIKNPSFEVQLEAVKQNGLVIRFIENPSEAVKLEAVKQNGFTIQFIENPSFEIQLEAVKQNGFTIQFIENPSFEIQLEAVKKNGFTIRFIENPSEELKLVAVKRSGYALQYIKNPSVEVQIEAVKENSWAIQYIENPSEAVKLVAVKKNGYSIKFIKNPSEEVQIEAVKQSGWVIQFIKNPSVKVQIEAVKQYGYSIRFIENPSEEVLKYLEKKPQIKDFNPEYEFNDNDLFLISRHLKKHGLDSLSIRTLKKEFVVTPVIQNLISKLNGKDLTAKILKEYDESLGKEEETDLKHLLKELLKHSKLLKSVWDETSQRIFKNKNHVFLLGTPIKYITEKKLQEYSTNTNHPSVQGYLTLIWVRYTKFKNHIWVDEIQSDLDKVAEINTKNLYNLILKKFIQYHSSKGFKIFYYPTYNIKRKFYKADPPASIYKDLPKKFRFKLLDQVDFDTKKQLLNKEKVWKLEARLN